MSRIENSKSFTDRMGWSNFNLLRNVIGSILCYGPVTKSLGMETALVAVDTENVNALSFRPNVEILS